MLIKKDNVEYCSRKGERNRPQESINIHSICKRKSTNLEESV